MEKDRDRQAAIRHRACRSRPDGAGRPLGELAFARGRMDSKFRHHPDRAERTLRRVAQPNAGCPQTSVLAGLAWGGTRRPVRSKGPARAVSVRGNDLLAGKRAGWKREK